VAGLNKARCGFDSHTLPLESETLVFARVSSFSGEANSDCELWFSSFADMLESVPKAPSGTPSFSWLVFLLSVLVARKAFLDAWERSGSTATGDDASDAGRDNFDMDRGIPLGL
jgi:hypothetical protein